MEKKIPRYHRFHKLNKHCHSERSEAPRHTIHKIHCREAFSPPTPKPLWRVGSENASRHHCEAQLLGVLRNAQDDNFYLILCKRTGANDTPHPTVKERPFRAASEPSKTGLQPRRKASPPGNDTLAGNCHSHRERSFVKGGIPFAANILDDDLCSCPSGLKDKVWATRPSACRASILAGRFRGDQERYLSSIN